MKNIYKQFILILPIIIYYFNIIYLKGEGYSITIYKTVHISFFIMASASFFIGIKYNITSDKVNYILVIVSCFLMALALFFIKLSYKVLYFTIKELVYFVL